MAETGGIDRSYVMVFATTLGLALGALVAAALYIQPLDGELTRLGSYSERDFGGNMSQRRLTGGANQVDAFSGGGDVLVVGDSFSTNGAWQPYLGRETGLSWKTLDIRKTSLDGLIASQKYRDDPPRIVIVQCVERELVNFFGGLEFGCGDVSPREFEGSLPPLVRRDGAQPVEERRPLFAPARLNLRYAASVAVKTLAGHLLGENSGSVRRFDLTTNALFSNRRCSEILVYEGDLDAPAWSKAQIDRAVCAVRGLQDSVERSGVTLFLFLLAPDKASAYAQHFVDPVMRRRPDTTQYLVNVGVRAIRVDLDLGRAIAAGERDIYSPNGSHWSQRGYEIAAAAIAGHLREIAAEARRRSGG